VRGPPYNPRRGVHAIPLTRLIFVVALAGALTTALPRAQEPLPAILISRQLAQLEELSAGDTVELATDERGGSARSFRVAGIYEPINATLHPGKLGQGLAQLARNLGVEIYEHTRVTALVRTAPARLATRGGCVTAPRVVVATNAWAATLPELKRQFVCVGSAIVATPPIPERLEEIGWNGGESITDGQVARAGAQVLRQQEPRAKLPPVELAVRDIDRPARGRREPAPVPSATARRRLGTRGRPLHLPRALEPFRPRIAR